MPAAKVVLLEMVMFGIVFRVKIAATEQLDVIAPVVYVLPDSVPPQPVTDDIYPVLGVTVNDVVAL